MNLPAARAGAGRTRTGRGFTAAAVLIGVVAVLAAGCARGDASAGSNREVAVNKSSASVRAARRAYDGAPPTIPHQAFGASCASCHDRFGQSVSGVGFAPASPHDDTPRAGGTQRCRQCHVFVTSDDLFVDSEFIALAQDLRSGGRATPGAPPTIPHRTLMRENCIACHGGPAAREEIRTTHPERWRCRQCHVPETTRYLFNSAFGRDLIDGDQADGDRTDQTESN
jgi:nitrate reductase cytochrome c-type subunit